MFLPGISTAQNPIEAKGDCILIGYMDFWIAVSVTRLGDLLDFGQLFKAFGNNQFAQISHILREIL